MSLQLELSEEYKVSTSRTLISVPEWTGTPSAWKAQKPRISSARIMMEVRRRLWIEACSENTGFHQTEKLIASIRALNKRIEKRPE